MKWIRVVLVYTACLAFASLTRVSYANDTAEELVWSRTYDLGGTTGLRSGDRLDLTTTIDGLRFGVEVISGQDWWDCSRSGLTTVYFYAGSSDYRWLSSAGGYYPAGWSQSFAVAAPSGQLRVVVQVLECQIKSSFFEVYRVRYDVYRLKRLITPVRSEKTFSSPPANNTMDGSVRVVGANTGGGRETQQRGAPTQEGGGQRSGLVYSWICWAVAAVPLLLFVPWILASIFGRARNGYSNGSRGSDWDQYGSYGNAPCDRDPGGAGGGGDNGHHGR